MRSIKSSPSILPSSCPFQNVSVPESMELIIYPYRSLVESQEVNSIVGKDSVGHVIEIHQNFTFSELKICIFNGALCNVPSSSSSSSRPLSKEEYSKRLKSFRIWILDPVSSSTNWIQLRSQTDWERVKVLKWLESSSQERLKLLYDEGVILSRKIDKSCGNGDIDDSVTTNTNPRRDSDSVDHGETDRLEQERRPRLHLLTERKPVNEHNSPIKQQQMAKILEQRIILSRI